MSSQVMFRCPLAGQPMAALRLRLWHTVYSYSQHVPMSSAAQPSASRAPQFFVKQLWTDKEIGGRMYMQLSHLFPQQLLQDQKDRFFKHAFAAMHKLSAMKYHLENYSRIEEEQYKKSVDAFQKSQTELREAFEL